MGDVISSTGIVFEMLDEIGANLNFSYTVVPPADNEFGVRKKGSNEYTGMMGQLINQDAFIAAAPFIVNLDKQMYVNFSTEFDMQPYSFMYSKRRDMTKFLLFVYPFTPLVSHTQCIWSGTPWSASLCTSGSFWSASGVQAGVECKIAVQIVTIQLGRILLNYVKNG